MRIELQAGIYRIDKAVTVLKGVDVEVRGQGPGTVFRRPSPLKRRLKRFIRWLRGDPLNVTDYGAVHDGVTNDAPAIQAAINAAYWREVLRRLLPYVLIGGAVSMLLWLLLG